MLVLLISILLTVACGGSGSSGDEVADAEAAEIGKPLTNGEWTVELARPAERSKIIGEGNLVYQSEQGIYLIVFTTVRNGSGTLQVVPRDLFTLTDGTDTEYRPTKSAIQVAYIQHKGKEQDLEIVLDSPMKDGEEREGVIVFEVSTDGAEYTLRIKDASDTLAIGF